ncbi:unnamed protein product [Triticum turgidum subsp. durum]|uniref:Knottins-like domain-containing protein n=1 Tax=Triticum turgidum subsp. durum TaxID=4567 RepID=A0A9R0TUX0_TRITD|nr:unnamed protein product [Triticum turgidum subsp. durum]
MESPQKLRPLIIMAMLLLLVMAAEGHKHCPEDLCEGPSGKFKGACSQDDECQETCGEEGFHTGFCKVGPFNGACKCFLFLHYNTSGLLLLWPVVEVIFHSDGLEDRCQSPVVDWKCDVFTRPTWIHDEFRLPAWTRGLPGPNQDSYTCAVVEVFHENTQIIIMEVSTSMTINGSHGSVFVKVNRHVASIITGRR